MNKIEKTMSIEEVKAYMIKNTSFIPWHASNCKTIEEFINYSIDYCKDLLLSVEINNLDCYIGYDTDRKLFFFVNVENEYLFNSGEIFRIGK